MPRFPARPTVFLGPVPECRDCPVCCQRPIHRPLARQKSRRCHNLSTGLPKNSTVRIGKQRHRLHKLHATVPTLRHRSSKIGTAGPRRSFICCRSGSLRSSVNSGIKQDNEMRFTPAKVYFFGCEAILNTAGKLDWFSHEEACGTKRRRRLQTIALNGPGLLLGHKPSTKFHCKNANLQQNQSKNYLRHRS